LIEGFGVWTRIRMGYMQYGIGSEGGFEELGVMEGNRR